MGTNLDGITLLRYAHILRNRTSGGSEQYLKQLNDGLLANNRMTILQMYLVPTDSEGSAVQVEVEQRGQGQIVWIPVCFHSEERSLRSLPRRLRLLAASRTFGISRGKWAVFPMVQRALANAVGHLRYPEMILSENLSDVLDNYNVDLIVFHWLSYDVGTLVSLAARRRIPYAIIHHFENSRLRRARTRRWLRGAAAVGGVSGRDVPPDLEHKYVNLSDAVDSEFFSPAQATPIKRPEGFMVFLPSRVIAGKGHADLLLAVQDLARAGAKFSVVFAGAMESKAVEGSVAAYSFSIGFRRLCCVSR